MNHYEASDWWLALDRQAVRNAAEEAADHPALLILQGAYWQAGAYEGLSVVEQTFRSHGHHVVRPAPLGAPQLSVKSQLLECMNRISPVASVQLSPSAVFARATETEIVEELAARIHAEQDSSFVFILDDIDRLQKVKAHSLELLDRLRRKGHVSIAVSCSGVIDTRLVPAATKLPLFDFTLEDVTECVQDAPLVSHSPTSALGLCAELFDGRQSMRPALVYAILRSMQ